MTHATFLDVTCPHCSYVGPAALVNVPETDYVQEHWTVVCPTCSRAWIVDTFLGQPISNADINRISSDGA